MANSLRQVVCVFSEPFSSLVLILTTTTLCILGYCAKARLLFRLPLRQQKSHVGCSADMVSGSLPLCVSPTETPQAVSLAPSFARALRGLYSALVHSRVSVKLIFSQFRQVERLVRSEPIP